MRGQQAWKKVITFSFHIVDQVAEVFWGKRYTQICVIVISIQKILLFAPACIQKGDNFKQVIHNIIKNVSCVILVLSPSFFEKCVEEDDMVRYELKEALSRPNITFIPVIMEGFSFEKETECIKHIFTEDKQWIYDNF